MIKILVVDDDAKLTQSVCTYLNDSGYDAKGCLSAEAAYDEMYGKIYNLIISDIMMPGVDGFELAETVRWLNKSVPILFMSARDDLPAKQKGFDLGIDDYMVKPIDFSELLMRVRALLRRAKGPARPGRNPALLTAGDLSLDTEQRVAIRDGRTIDLAAKEYDLIELLMKNPRRVYSRESLMNLVWGYSYAGDYRTVDVHIRRLREKLERVPAEPEYIMTKWGVGYYFAGENQPTV